MEFMSRGSFQAAWLTQMVSKARCGVLQSLRKAEVQSSYLTHCLIRHFRCLLPGSPAAGLFPSGSLMAALDLLLR